LVATGVIRADLSLLTISGFGTSVLASIT
jgi:hypothetical protein